MTVSVGKVTEQESTIGPDTGRAPVVIVTGSSSGFGRLTAQTLARQG